MAKSARRPQQLYSIVMWILSLVFAGFLMGMGSLIIRDLPKVDQSITLEQFVDQDALTAANNAVTLQEREQVQLERNLEDANTAMQTARADYQSARASFNNWLDTRSVTESDAQNPEVVARTRALEALQSTVRAAERRVEDAQTDLRQARRVVEDARSARNRLRTDARPEYNRALRSQELRVFLFRLALTLPLLIAAGWMAAKKRSSAYWPLYRGFIIFALFAFFVELVPYLPSYGGYVRFAVGIVMVILVGHFIIRGMRRYMARKQAEEERSETERRQSIGYETALKKITANTCPGCDRPIISREGTQTDFCVHCGIRLACNCKSCGTRNISFHKFCLSCGTPSEAASEVAESPA